MRLLLHLWASAPCRIIRLALAEKQLAFEARIEKVWERRTDFLKLSPGGDVPVLVEPDGTTLTHAWVISEYLDEVYPELSLIGHTVVDRVETRRLFLWFEQRFGTEVTDNLAGEKIMKRFVAQSQPSSDAIRAGLANIDYHLDYIDYLAERRKWLAGDALTMADLAAAAHLSVCDYLGDVPWDRHAEARSWYARIKSRPGFRPLLDDLIPGLPPPDHYRDLDF